MFVEPEERLTRRAQFLDLVENEPDRFLHTTIGIFLVTIACFHEADWGEMRCDRVILRELGPAASRNNRGAVALTDDREWAF